MKSNRNKIKILNVKSFMKDLRKNSLVISRVFPFEESYFVETSAE